MALVLCTSSDNVFCLYQFNENIFYHFKVIYRADTISILKITKGYNSVRNVDGVMLLFADCLLMFYTCTKFAKISPRGFGLKAKQYVF